ncbi:MAG: hypothetical protein WCS70_03080 [Verrucomicrobiota bacterium]
MSLKAFHLFFVVIAALFCVGFGVWCFSAEEVRGQSGFALAGILSFASVAGLAVFEIYFLRRMRGVK